MVVCAIHPAELLRFRGGVSYTGPNGGLLLPWEVVETSLGSGRRK